MSEEQKVRCPECTSTQIDAGTRGWSPLAGMIGAGQIVLTCLKCGHKFAPVTRPQPPLPGGEGMTKTFPWHSIKSDVHHVCSNCKTGNNIENENRRAGTGGNKPLCSECRDLIAKGEC